MLWEKEEWVKIPVLYPIKLTWEWEECYVTGSRWIRKRTGRRKLAFGRERVSVTMMGSGMRKESKETRKEEACWGTLLYIPFSFLSIRVWGRERKERCSDSSSVLFLFPLSISFFAQSFTIFQQILASSSLPHPLPSLFYQKFPLSFPFSFTLSLFSAQSISQVDWDPRISAKRSSGDRIFPTLSVSRFYQRSIGKKLWKKWVST